jgi:hypothetical protein
MGDVADGDDERIDWAGLHTTLGTGDWGGTEIAQLALAVIIGDAALRDAVDCYVGSRPGSEVARSVLMHVKPVAAHDRCLEIYRQDRDPMRRQLALDLFRYLAVHDDAPLVSEFLANTDPSIQNLGIGVLDQLVWADEVEAEEAETYLVAAEQHANPGVRETAEWIRGVLRRADGGAT